VTNPKNSFNKSPELDTREVELFFPQRKTLYYHQGDTTSRLLSPSYLNALFLRKAQQRKKSPYLFLTKLVDR
jgi:hypothetical protein